MSGENRNFNAALVKAQSARSMYQRVRIPLDLGLKKGRQSDATWDMPFMGLWLYDVSSSTVQISVRFNSRHDTGAEIPLKKNMIINHDEQVIDCVFTAPPQPGQWVEVIFAVDSKVNIGNIEQQIVGEVGLTPNVLSELASKRIIFGGYDVPDNGEYIHLSTRYGMGTVQGGRGSYRACFALNQTHHNEPLSGQHKVFRVPVGFELEIFSVIIHNIDASSVMTDFSGMVVAELKDEAALQINNVIIMGSIPEFWENEDHFDRNYQMNWNVGEFAADKGSHFFPGAFEAQSDESWFAADAGPALIDEEKRVAVALACIMAMNNDYTGYMRVELLGRLRPKL
jgi:hypothetical protein